MATPPALRIGNIHLIAQHVPHHTRLFTGFQRLHRRQILQPRQLLILSQRPAIAAPEHLFDQLPKFPFLHGVPVYAIGTMHLMPPGLAANEKPHGTNAMGLNPLYYATMQRRQ